MIEHSIDIKHWAHRMNIDTGSHSELYIACQFQVIADIINAKYLNQTGDENGIKKPHELPIPLPIKSNGDIKAIAASGLYKGKQFETESKMFVIGKTEEVPSRYIRRIKDVKFKGKGGELILDDFLKETSDTHPDEIMQKARSHLLDDSVYTNINQKLLREFSITTSEIKANELVVFKKYLDEVLQIRE